MRLTLEIQAHLTGKPSSGEIDTFVRNLINVAREPDFWECCVFENSDIDVSVAVDKCEVKLIRAEEDIPVDTNS